MPTPIPGETKEEWMSRCVPELINEGNDLEQAQAICASMWERRNQQSNNGNNIMNNELVAEISNGLMLPTLWLMEPLAFQQMLSIMQAKIKSGNFTAGPVDDANRMGLPIRDAGGGTAIISLNGPMSKGQTFRSFFGFGTSIDALKAAFRQAAVDKDIDNILFKVTSPGGTVESLAELGDVIAEVADIKPIIGQIEGQAASAAFWAISQATKVVAGRGDMVGSIGVRTMLLDFSKAFEEIGIKAIAIDTGEFKSLGAQGLPITEAQIKHIQLLVNQNFEMFLEAVIRGREKMSRKDVLAAADGRMFMASDALEIGLIDEIATLPETLRSLRSKDNMGTLKARTRVAQTRTERRRRS